MSVWRVLAVLVVVVIQNLFGSRDSRGDRNASALSPTRTDIDEQQHRLAERRYWKWSLIVTGAPALIAVAGLYFAYGAMNASWRAVEEARNQVETAQQSLLASERPWIKVLDLKVSRVEITPQWVEVVSEVRLRNIGKSPAVNVLVYPELVPSDSPLEPPSAVCDRAKRFHKGGGFKTYYVFTVFPEDEVKIAENGAFFLTSIEAFRKAKEAKLARDRPARAEFFGEQFADKFEKEQRALPLRDGFDLKACVVYQYVENQKVFGTSYSVSLFRNCPPVRCSFELDQPGLVPLDQLAPRIPPNGAIAD